ncbi:MAG: MutS-related protein [Terracidiphilus sp.]
MDAGEAHTSEETPGELYARRLRELNCARSLEQRREKLLGFAKLAVAAVTLIAAVVFLHYTKALEFLLLPVAGFLVLAVLQENLIRKLRYRARTISFYERGQARLEDRWAGTGESGERFLDPLHPYARDLDIFGPGSLFELLCTARTRAGEETLSAWLLGAAPVYEVIARQQALRELEGRVDFREKLFSLGETVRLGVHPEALAAWGESNPVFPAQSTRVVTRALAALWILSLVSWAAWGLSDVTAAITILNLGWAHRLYRHSEDAAGALEHAADDLSLLAGILALLEQEQFRSPRLLALQSALKRDGLAPSAAIGKLARLVEYVNSRHSLFLRPLDLVTFWSTQLVFAAERWQHEFGPAIRGWLKAVGEMEALTALAGYAYEHPQDVFAEFDAAGPVFDAVGIAHPLLPTARAVCNDLKLCDGLQLLILSGPNMAGKSTFIRSVGVNAVLAQCGAPVRAIRLRLSPLTVAASICILDSLSGGVSRFYAEIHRVKLISALAEGPVPVLFLLDELLSGTNSHDRLVGSEFIVRSFIECNAIGIVSTHDLALTKIPEELDGRAVNCHFEDRFEDGQLIFDYLLKPGVVKSSNALLLMRSIGLGVDVHAALDLPPIEH